MENQIVQEYHGKQIKFDEKKEEWFVNFEGKLQYHKSLQIIKNYIDRLNKKAFDRVPVFVSKRRSYYNREEEYEKAVITSVGVDGTIYIVREGQKNAEHCYCAYVQNEKNEALIKEIAVAYQEKKDAEKKYEVARKKLEEIDFNGLKKKALGEIDK